MKSKIAVIMLAVFLCLTTGLLGDPLFTAARGNFFYSCTQILGFGGHGFSMGKGIHINAQSIWLLYFCTPHRRMRR